jgi:hypothetical protein
LKEYATLQLHPPYNAKSFNDYDGATKLTAVYKYCQWNKYFTTKSSHSNNTPTTIGNSLPLHTTKHKGM